MIVEPGKGDDVKARFAVNGLAMYAARPEGEQDRAMLAAALLEALRWERPPWCGRSTSTC